MESSQRPLTLIFLTGAGTSQREQNRGTLKRLKSLQLYHLACLIVYTVVKTGGLWAPRIFQCQLNSNIIAMADWITGGQSKPEASYSMNLQHHAVVAKSSIIGPRVRPGCILQWLWTSNQRYIGRIKTHNTWLIIPLQCTSLSIFLRLHCRHWQSISG